MNENFLLLKKLAAYTSAAVGFLYGNNIHAQIIYHDVIPDDTLSPQGFYGEFAGFDLNNDGIFDFWVGHAAHVFHYWYGEVILNPENTSLNSVMGSRQYKPWSTSNNVSPSSYVRKYPFQLSYNDVIGDGSNWVKPHSFNGLNNLDHYGQAWFRGVLWHTDWYGLWDNGQTAYAGVRLNDNGVYYYGWIRLKVNIHAQFVIVKDFALNSQPDEPILAGEGIVSAVPEISTEKIMSLSPNPVGDHATIRFSLATPSTVELELQDMQGRKIGTIEAGNSYSKGMNSIELNAEDLPAGGYLLVLATDNERHTIKMMKL